MIRKSTILVCLSLLALGCGGGSSPSEPRTTSPVALEGNWAGSAALSSPRATCSLSLTLARDGVDLIGNWTGQCPNIGEGHGVVVTTPLVANLVLVTGLQGAPLFGGCGWSSVATRDGDRLRGQFSTPANCSGGPPLEGQLELTKR